MVWTIFKVAVITSSVAKITLYWLRYFFSVADTILLVTNITFVVAGIIFKVAVISSLLAKITFVVV